MMPQKKAGANGYRNVETMSTPNPFVAVQVNLVSEVSFQKLIVVSSPPHVGPVGVVDHEVCPLH